MILTARDVAVSSLSDRAGNVSAHLDRLLSQAQLKPADAGFARELALGAVRRKATLEVVLRAFLARPDKPLPAGLANIMHVALYQLLFLERVPDFAAVNEAVNQASDRGFAAQRGMVNGLLRSIIRSMTPIEKGRPELKSEVVPVGPDAYRTLGKPIFPAPSSDPAGYLAAAYSLPAELAGRWLRRLGLYDAAGMALQANARAPFILRVNRLRTDIAGAQAALAAEGVETSVHANGMSLVLTEHANIAQLQAFKDGLVQPQDPTATAVSVACSVQGGMNVLDFCAAPGTKTTHLAELMGNVGSITALDVSEEKLHRINENCERMGITIVKTMLAPQVTQLTPASFDVVLADVPCSNTGVLARRAESRWQFSESRLASLVKDQRFLAAAAGMFVKKGGRLIYSTCSVEPDENEQMAMHLSRQKRLTLERQLATLPGGADDPHQWHDGGYHAIFTAG